MLTGKETIIYEFLREHVERWAKGLGKAIGGVTLIADEDGKYFKKKIVGTES